MEVILQRKCQTIFRFYGLQMEKKLCQLTGNITKKIKAFPLKIIFIATDQKCAFEKSRIYSRYFKQPINKVFVYFIYNFTKCSLIVANILKTTP